MHEKFIFERNIQHFRILLDGVTDLDRIRVLQRLLDAECDGLAALEAGAGRDAAEDFGASLRRVDGGSTPLASASKP